MAPESPFRILMVVPTLGVRLGTLERTLASIDAQHEVGVDVVVVAPAANEPLRTVVSRHRARIVLDGGHISAAVNCGFAQAGPEHRYLAWIGDHDFLYPRSTRTIVRIA